MGKIQIRPVQNERGCKTRDYILTIDVGQYVVVGFTPAFVSQSTLPTLPNWSYTWGFSGGTQNPDLMGPWEHCRGDCVGQRVERIWAESHDHKRPDSRRYRTRNRTRRGRCTRRQDRVGVDHGAGSRWWPHD